MVWCGLFRLRDGCLDEDAAWVPWVYQTECGKESNITKLRKSDKMQKRRRKRRGSGKRATGRCDVDEASPKEFRRSFP